MQVGTINKHSQARLEQLYAALAEVMACMDAAKYVIATYDEDNRLPGKLWTVPTEDEITADFKKAVDSINELINTVRKRESELLSREWRNL